MSCGAGMGNCATDEFLAPDSWFMSPARSREECLAHFDRDGDGALNLAEFSALARALFRNGAGAPYKLEGAWLERVFLIFDVDADGLVNEPEFGRCWDAWITKILHPVSALLIIDVQNDFISGSLAVGACPAGQDGAEVVEPINALLESVPFAAIVYSLDWHPPDHVSFARNVALRPLHASSPINRHEDAHEFDIVTFEPPPVVRSQKLWPAHCEQGTWGAELHPDLQRAPSAVIVHKGTNSDVDSYSAFWDNAKLGETELRAGLQARGVTDVYVCGLAYDFCVGATALHALEHGYRTVLVDDACRGMVVEDIEATKEKVRAGHGAVVDVARVNEMVEAKDRRPELGFKLAIEIEKDVKVTKDE